MDQRAHLAEAPVLLFFQRKVGLDVVHSPENETAALSKLFGPSLHLRL
jgi:hypothetical protein